MKYLVEVNNKDTIAIFMKRHLLITSKAQLTLNCSKSTMETPVHCVKSVQS